MSHAWKFEQSQQLSQALLNRGPMNTIRQDDLLALADFIRQCQKAGSRCLLVSSAIDSVFSYGIDPEEILSKNDDQRLEIFIALAKLIEAHWQSPIPVMTVIDGPAMAGGAVLAAMGDFVFMDASRAKLCFSEVKVRLPVPEFVQRLIMRKTPRHGLEMALLGKNLDASMALDYGFADALYQNEEQKQRLLDGYVGRLMRLDAHVVGETLLANKRQEKAFVETFLQRPAEFKKYVGDAYLGKGIRDLIERS